MKKGLFSIIALFILLSTTTAQQGDLFVKQGDRGPYIEHTVTPKQSFFAIGRIYTVHPKHIAAYNRVDMNKGLAIGEVIRIPLSDTNFVQKGNSGVPLYYKTSEKEGLTKISNSFNKVSLENLRNWNGISENSVSAGTNVVVGFLVSKELPSVTLNNNKAAPVQAPKQEKSVTEKKPEAVQTTPPVVAEKKVTPPVETKPAPVETKPAPVEDTRKTEPVYTSKPVQSSAAGSGYFKSHYDQQLRQQSSRKEETVTSGIFKTTSGWVDNKYYLLIDKVQPGTIVKITNPANSKVIFAKVLGEMSSIRQNDGLNIRISSAGASALEIAEDDKFIVKVNY